MKTIVLALLPALYLSACAPSREAAREPAARGNQDPLGKFESDFRPSDHDTIAPPPAPHPGAPSAWKKGDTAGAVSATDTVGELVPGFRVQIYSTTDIDQAKAKKLEAEGDFPTEWFYLQYDPPTYKIRGETSCRGMKRKGSCAWRSTGDSPIRGLSRRRYSPSLLRSTADTSPT